MALLNSISSSLTGMKVAQAQLEIVSNNIANVDTQGYTRKTAAQSAIVVAGQTMGVTMENAKRTVDEGLLKNFLSSNSVSSSLSSQYDYLSRMDSLMGTPADGNSVAANVGNLQSALETFSTQVSSIASRYSLLTAANELTGKLNYISSNIQTLRGDADREIADAAQQVNSLLHSIDALNVDIVKYTVLNRDGVANLKDQRDNALRDLSGYMDITYYTRDTGAVVVQTASGTTLLDTEVYEISHVALAQVGSDNSYDSGNIQGIFVDGKDITSSISGGSMGGLITIRDTTLTSLQGQLDELSYVIYNELNAVHNQGTAYPNMPSKMIGSTTFIADLPTNPNDYNQKIKLENGDVRFIIFDENGNQKATTTLLSGIGFNQNGDTLDGMVSNIQAWLQSATGANLPYAQCYIDGNSHLVIDTGDSNYSLSIIDETSSNAGSDQVPVKLNFDANGDGTYDQIYEGFCDFFGLNNFFANNMNDYIWDSRVLNNRAAIGVNGAKWSFSDSVNGYDYGSVDISRAMTIQDIAEQINNNANLNTHVKASIIKNGDGYMLRVESLEGAQLEISETNSLSIQDKVLDKLNMVVSSCNYAANISVREDIRENANLITCGTPTFDNNRGAYSINAASNNIANKLADALSSNHTFKQSGTMAKTTTSVNNYVSSFVGNISSLAHTAESSFEYQSALTQAISDKEAQTSGIDLDEELAQMIIYQQSYAACAQVFTASREILDVLINMV